MIWKGEIEVNWNKKETNIRHSYIKKLDLLMMSKLVRIAHLLTSNWLSWPNVRKDSAPDLPFQMIDLFYQRADFPFWDKYKNGLTYNKYGAERRTEAGRRSLTRIKPSQQHLDFDKESFFSLLILFFDIVPIYFYHYLNWKCSN